MERVRVLVPGKVVARRIAIGLHCTGLNATCREETF